MHIPSEMLSTSVCPVTAAVAAAGVAASVYALKTGKFGRAPKAKSFALVSAAVFGMQMLNYPVWNGISGHLIGGVFAAAILGVPAAVLSIALVLLVQTLLFADGGILMLGANILNMSLIGAGVGGLIFYRLEKKGVGEGYSAFAASALSVLLASMALAAELIFSGKGGWEAPSLLVAVHAALAVVEGAATAVLIKIVGARDGAEMSRRSVYILAGAVLIALCAAPFASAFPDAFEWTMENFNLLPDAPNFTNAPFADYAVASLGDGFMSAFAAGAIGAAAVALASFALYPIFSKFGK